MSVMRMKPTTRSSLCELWIPRAHPRRRAQLRIFSLSAATPKINIRKSLDDIRNDPHNSPPSLIAANENEAIKTNCSLKIYSR